MVLIDEILSYDLTATKGFGDSVCRSHGRHIFRTIIRTIVHHNQFSLRTYYDDDNLDCNKVTMILLCQPKKLFKSTSV